MSKILVIGDTHGSPDTIGRVAAEYEDQLNKDDYLIIAGDFGFVWRNEPNPSETYWLNWLDGLPWTTLFVCGNHDNFTRLYNYPEVEWHGGRVHRINDSVLHLMRGYVFDIGDTKWFCFGGAQSIDKAYRTPYVTWWPEEQPNQEEYDRAVKNLKKIDFKPDFILTHEMPDSYVREFYGSKYRGGSKTAYMLNDFLYQCYGYRKWFCGHHHIDAAIRPDFQICYKRIYEVE